MLSATWALPLVLIIRLIRPVFLLRIGRIHSERIGHFVSDVAEQLCRQKTRRNRTLDIFFFGEASNKHWELMARRSDLHVYGWWLNYLWRWNRFIPGGHVHEVKTSKTNSRDLEGLFTNHKNLCALPFTVDEVRRSQEWLISKGWKKSEPFVVLHVRDSEYLRKTRTDIDFSYHDYRNSDITNYRDAMEWLADQKVWVVRVGKIVSKQFISQNKMIIDYATSDERDDLLDIWLFANSSAIISTASGPDYLGGIYQVPTLFINALPLFDIASYFNMTWVPKHLVWKNNKKELNMREHLDYSFYSQQEYDQHGIEIMELDSIEIAAHVREFWERINGKLNEEPNDLANQDDFWGALKEYPRFSMNHGFIHPNARLGPLWLKDQDRSFLELRVEQDVQNPSEATSQR